MALADPVKQSFLLLEFSFGTISDTTGEFIPGAPAFQRYTNYDRSLNYNGNLYISKPEMEVDFGSYNGSAEQDETEIRMSYLGDSFLNLIVGGEPVQSMSVVISELLLDPVTADCEVLTLYKGTVASTTRNPNRDLGIIKLVCWNAKNKLNVTLGLPCIETCINAFGDTRCKKTPLFLQTLVTSISGVQVTLGAPDLILFHPRRFVRGSLVSRGLRIGIKEVDGQNVILVRRPPSTWLFVNPADTANVVYITDGCDKRASTCQTIHSNIENFNGLGIGMPSHNPNFENPSV